MSREILITAALLVAVLLAGCTTDQVGKDLVPPPVSTVATPPISKELPVDIHIDATLSMEGFVSPGAAKGGTTHYCQLLPRLESAALTGWKDSKVSFFQFGTIVVPVSGRGHVMASEPSFYYNKAVNRETNIQKVLERAGPDRLTVIVTDLFQTNTDSALLVAGLKERFLSQNLAVGVLGLRSQFDGVIYDLNVLGGKLPYRSGVSPATFRPFYLLMMGNHADVVHYFRQLLSFQLPFVNPDNFCLFSRYYVPSQNLLANVKILPKTTRLVQVNSLFRKTITQPMKQFRLRDKDATLELAMERTVEPYTMPFDESRLEHEIVVVSADKKEWAPDPSAASGFKVEQLVYDPSAATIRLLAKVHHQHFKPDRIYAVKCVVFPGNDAFRLPAWPREWDMGVSRVDGARTLNIDLFMLSLWRASNQIARPELGEFTICLRKIQ